MNTHRSFRPALLGLLVAAVGAFWLAAPATARADSYGAIAYSQNTGHYGYGYGYGSRAGAELEALANCAGDDAQIVTWCVNSYAALALGDNGAYGYAWGNSRGEAEYQALCYCRQHGGHAHIACWVYSGD